MDFFWVFMSYGVLCYFVMLFVDIISYVMLISGLIIEGIVLFDVIFVDFDGCVCVEVDGLMIK